MSGLIANTKEFYSNEGWFTHTHTHVKGKGFLRIACKGFIQRISFGLNMFLVPQFWGLFVFIL